MVVEFLTFTVPVAERDEWLRIEERHWSRFLEHQRGFVRKEMWADIDDPTELRAAIWWTSMEAWKSIPLDALDEVIAAMGPCERSPTCVAFDVIRQS